MKTLDFFDRYIRKEEASAAKSKDVWSYTRVSSKEQFENNSSINRQKEANEEYVLS